LEAPLLGRGRFALLYLLLVVLPLAGFVIVLQIGRGLHAHLTETAADAAMTSTLMQNGLRVSVLLIQVIVIIVASRTIGWLLRRFRQPQVVGEMLAGILLGPSLLGAAAPAVYWLLFPTGSLRFLNALSQIGLLLFMFLVGLELDPRLLRERGHAAILTSHASITAPMLLGSAFALALYPRLADASVPFVAFALFLGAAMSITAFPVLARILNERGLQHTRLGATVIACAAVDDVSAWCVLAVVVAVARKATSAIPLWLTIGGAAAFVLLMFGVVRPALEALYRRNASRSRISQDVVATVIVIILGSALATEWLGIHALFGAFLAGVVMPKEELLVAGLLEKFEDLMVSLLLPLFFAYTGLRMSVGLLRTGNLWLLCLAVLGIAVVGKFGGCALAARLTGVPWREASVIGALMNTRGLVELIILNVGLDLKVISPTLFTMMVLMALVTTLMTTPLIDQLYPANRKDRIAREGRRGEDVGLVWE
jgi:K+:H+ antiporter